MTGTGFSHAIARQPGANAGDGLTTAGLGSPDPALMLAQHAACLRALEACGVSVLKLPPDPACPDGCFVEDVAVITPTCAVITRPGAPSRRAEPEAIEPLLARHRPLARIHAPGTLDGGDVVIAGQRVLIGLSARTNPEGAQQLSRILAEHGLAAQTVPVIDGLHLKSDISFIGDNRLLLTARYTNQPELAGFEHVLVAAGEDYAANCVAHGNRMLLPAGFPRTAGHLARLGFALHELEMSEFRKMDGGLSCLSLRFDS